MRRGMAPAGPPGRLSRLASQKVQREWSWVQASDLSWGLQTSLLSGVAGRWKTGSSETEKRAYFPLDSEDSVDSGSACQPSLPQVVFS
jgi:hypothetical protein